MHKLFFALLFLLPSFARAADYDTVRIEHVFAHQKVNFDPKAYPTGMERRGSSIVLGNGRVWLRKIALPKSPLSQRASVRVRLRSAGDPWDKYGSVFIIPTQSAVSMLGVGAGTQQYPQADSLRYEKFRGIVAGKDFVPVVELLRFMTPFGVGAFNPKDSVRKENVTPRYIDGFAPYVIWEANITDRLPLFADSVYTGVTVDSWTSQGYELDLSLIVEQSRLKADKARRTRVLSLANTYPYIGQEPCDLFSRQPLSVPFVLQKAGRDARLYYIASGHGGHSNGDEFTRCEHILRMDGKEVKRFVPWRNDCASFRRFNPSTGVWLVPRNVSYINNEGKRAVKQIEEPIASSDLSRSNWCPGSDVFPEEVRLGNLNAGEHTFLIDIPTAQAIQGSLYNHWIVSAWLVWEE